MLHHQENSVWLHSAVHRQEKQSSILHARLYLTRDCLEDGLVDGAYL